MNTGYLNRISGKDFNPKDYFDILPKNLNVGKLVEILEGSSFCGGSGKIIDHYINGDDCSGNYGKEMYLIEYDREKLAIASKLCEIIENI